MPIRHSSSLPGDFHYPIGKVKNWRSFVNTKRTGSGTRSVVAARMPTTISLLVIIPNCALTPAGKQLLLYRSTR